MSWNRWNWLEDGALPLAMVTLRFCWLWPWLELVQRWLAPSCQGTLLPASLVIGLLLGGMAATHWTWRRANTLIRGRILVGGAGLAVILLVLWWQFYRPLYPLWNLRWVGTLALELTDWGNDVPLPFVALLAVAYLWLRGVQDGHRKPLVRQDIWSACTTGVFALVVLMIASALDVRGLPASTSSLVLLFFATGLAALALSSLEMAARSGQQLFEAQLKLHRYWLGSVTSVIAALLGLGLLLGALIAPETVAQVLSGIVSVTQQVLIFVIMLISLILYPILYLLSFALTPLLQRLFELFGDVLPRIPQFPLALRPEGQPGGETGIFDNIPEGFRWVALAVFFLGVGLAFALALRRLMASKVGQEGIEEVRELILSRDLVQDALRRLWHNWLSWLRRRSKTTFSPFLSLEGEPRTRRLIRAIYQAFLSVAREREQPRLHHQTPIEYQGELEVGLPTSRDALGIITEEYVQARYGLEPPTVGQVKRAFQAWEQLKATLEPQDGEEAG